MRKFIALLLAMVLPLSALAEPLTASTLTADANVTTVEMSDTLYGLFFEDINYGADGGLYAELLQNRSFEYEDILNPRTPDHYNGWGFNLAFGAAGKADGSHGIVAAYAGDDLHAACGVLYAEINEGFVLVERLGGVFAGSSVNNYSGGAACVLHVDKLRRLGVINVVILVEGGYHGSTAAGKNGAFAHFNHPFSNR